MTPLPEEFITRTRAMMGDERFSQYMKAFDEEPPVSIRLNPLKAGTSVAAGAEPVPWCREGWYLPRRPQFTMDPLLHAGCYYVQEAASMFVSHVLRQLTDRPVSVLDLCAAPGGKSTAAISALPAGSTLCSNEPDRRRASVLLENITKWGYEGCTVTNSYPRDFSRAGLKFDVVISDVPCSGEGMFRRDAATIGEWSTQQVEHCQRLQRDIAAEAWQCLNAGGIMIYSTCTLNTEENEENISWMLSELDGAEAVAIETRPEWRITGSLLSGLTAPVYRFIPGITRTEGLFVCVLRKGGTGNGAATPESGHTRRKCKQAATGKLHVLTAPAASRATAAPRAGLAYTEAMAYLRGEAIVLPPEVPRGIVEVGFRGHCLGTVKNIGTRANNLYPKEWRIRTTHIPTDYEAILTDT